MADLCGGHPADVLIAVCLAAQTLTVPGMERGGRADWRMGWRERGLCCLGRSIKELLAALLQEGGSWNQERSGTEMEKHWSLVMSLSH